MRRTVMTTLIALLPGLALALDSFPLPAWQLVPARTGELAEVRFFTGPDFDFESLETVTVPGLGPVSWSSSPQDGLLQLYLPEAAEQPLTFRQLTVATADGTRSLDVNPVEVHWFDPGSSGGLFVRSAVRSDRALMLLLENGAEAELQLTDLRYAPASVSTGRLLLARDFGTLADILGLAEPVDALTGTYLATAAGDLDFSEFSFSDAPVTILPGEQVILVLGAAGFTRPGLFAPGNLSVFAPWLEYRQNGELHRYLPHVVINPRPGHP